MNKKYYHTKESVEEYIQLTKDVNGQQIIDRLKCFLPEGSTLLELGSGPGTDWKSLNEWYVVTGSDYSLEFIHHLQTRFPEGTFIQLNAITLGTEKTFNAIYSNKVLHHLTDEELKTSIKRQWEILEPDGFICHSFWKGEGSETFKGMLVNYHDEQKLKALFEEYFNLITIHPYQEFEEDDSLYLIAEKR